jgi:hypothetical protein
MLTSNWPPLAQPNPLASQCLSVQSIPTCHVLTSSPSLQQAKQFEAMLRANETCEAKESLLQPPACSRPRHSPRYILDRVPAGLTIYNLQSKSCGISAPAASTTTQSLLLRTGKTVERLSRPTCVDIDRRLSEPDGSCFCILTLLKTWHKAVKLTFLACLWVVVMQDSSGLRT